MNRLIRRGYDLGDTTLHSADAGNNESRDWALGKPVLLPSRCLALLADQADHIEQSLTLYEAILNGQDCDPILASPPYSARVDAHFDSLGGSVNQGDDQEIETVLFDAVANGEVLAEDLWMKISWLSFDEEDASLRFRFSFGEDHIEDVAADPLRQSHAAVLTDAIFPESRLITQNQALNRYLENLLACDQVLFVERIVYFNSPNGGAYLHHDLERGHAGVVYAQLSGATFWLALPRKKLMLEITNFVEACSSSGEWPDSIGRAMQDELRALVADGEKLASELESFANNSLIHLINETSIFVQQLITNGHSRLVQAGDVLLLPQASSTLCCWHSVFCLGAEPGQALSFAIRAG